MCSDANDLATIHITVGLTMQWNAMKWKLNRDNHLGSLEAPNSSPVKVLVIATDTEAK